MKNFCHQVFVLYKKDLLLEFRELDHLISIVLFGFLLLILFSFALSVEPELMRKMAPGLYWLAVLFSSMMTLEHSFQREDGQWDGLLLMGADTRALYLAKVFYHFSLVFLLQISLLPLMAGLFDLSLSWSLARVLLLGNLGIAILGTAYAGLTASLEGGQVLLPLLLFPMLAPVVLSAVKVTELTLAADLFGQQVVWLKMLVLFDMVFLLGSLLCADIFFDPT